MCSRHRIVRLAALILPFPAFAPYPSVIARDEPAMVRAMICLMYGSQRVARRERERGAYLRRFRTLLLRRLLVERLREDVWVDDILRAIAGGELRAGLLEVVSRQPQIRRPEHPEPHTARGRRGEVHGSSDRRDGRGVM